MTIERITRFKCDAIDCRFEKEVPTRDVELYPEAHGSTVRLVSWKCEGLFIDGIESGHLCDQCRADLQKDLAAAWQKKLPEIPF